MSTLVLCCIREIKTLQVSILEHGHYDLFAYHHLKQFSLIEIVTSGWNSGSRTRQKRFQNIGKVYQYLNKLMQGAWMDEDSYNQAWNMVLRLDETLSARDYEPAEAETTLSGPRMPTLSDEMIGLTSKVRKMNWEVFPFSFEGPDSKN